MLSIKKLNQFNEFKIFSITISAISKLFLVYQIVPLLLQVQYPPVMIGHPQAAAQAENASCPCFCAVTQLQLKHLDHTIYFKCEKLSSGTEVYIYIYVIFINFTKTTHTLINSVCCVGIASFVPHIHSDPFVVFNMELSCSSAKKRKAA